jgi:hypothetical protein
LRFWAGRILRPSRPEERYVSTLLEILVVVDDASSIIINDPYVSTLLEILAVKK